MRFWIPQLSKDPLILALLFSVSLANTWDGEFIKGLHNGMGLSFNKTLYPLIGDLDLDYLALYDNYQLIRNVNPNMRNTAINQFKQIFTNFTQTAKNRTTLFADGNFSLVFSNALQIFQSASYFLDKALRYQRRTGRDAYSDIWTSSGYLFWERDFLDAGWNLGDIVISLIRTEAEEIKNQKEGMVIRRLTLPQWLVPRVVEEEGKVQKLHSWLKIL